MNIKSENRPTKESSLKKGGTLGLKEILIPKLPLKRADDGNESKKTINNFSMTKAKI